MFDSPKEQRNEQVVRRIDEFDIIHSKEEDVVAGSYRIQPHQPIAELSNEFVRYYLASHIDSGDEFYAIVFERTFCPDLMMIKSIINAKDNIFVRPIASSITRLSTNKIKHLALIVEKYDPKENLSKFVGQLEEGDTRFITSKLLPFLCLVLNFCELNAFNCGNINPENILIINDKLLLREPYIAYPHSMQDLPYLATELIDADYAGRKTSSVAADIFACGVTFLYVYFKGLAFPEGMDKLKHDRLDNGSFLSTIGKKRVSDDIKSHIKGCLNDNVYERWKLRNLSDWSSGKLSFSKNASSNDTSDIFAAVSFNGNNYNHYRALASALFRQWDAGLNFLSEERVLKWIQRGTGKSKVIDYLDELTSRDYATQGFVKALIDKDERLFKAILALDTQGPFRLNNFAAHLSSFGNLFHNGHVKQRKIFVENIIKISLKKSWEDKIKYNPKEELDEVVVNNLIELSSFYNSHTIGCGVERVLYHLNPDLPCLSPIVYNEYITSLRDILTILDNIASSSSEKIIFDRHIISFIANKISLKREVYVNMLKDVPMESDNLYLYGLAVIVLAISHEPDLELVNLSNLIGKRLSEFTDKTLHNVRVKKNIEDKIKNASEESDLAALLKIVSNPKVYINDQSGYYKACRDINMINKKINALTNNQEVKQFGTLFGQRITVLVSYLLFIIISIFMVI